MFRLKCKVNSPLASGQATEGGRVRKDIREKITGTTRPELGKLMKRLAPGGVALGRPIPLIAPT
jgi:hypothetical protein